MDHPWILLTDSEDPEHRNAWGPFPTFEAAKAVAVEDGHEPGSYTILPLMPTAPIPQPGDARARLIAAAPALAEALEALLRECFMTHKRWGDGCNRAAADAAQARARAALALLNPPPSGV